MQPVDRLRRRVEERRAEVAREDERGTDRQRQEQDERDVERRQDLRREARPEQRVQQRRRVVAAEDRAVPVGELAVEEDLGADERDDGLEVAVGHVRHVEAEQRAAGHDRPGRRSSARGARGPSPRATAGSARPPRARRGPRRRARRAAPPRARRARSTSRRRGRGRGTGRRRRSVVISATTRVTSATAGPAAIARQPTDRAAPRARATVLTPARVSRWTASSGSARRTRSARAASPTAMTARITPPMSSTT